MRLRGREDIHAGGYVRLFLGKRQGVTGAFAQSMFAYAIQHEFLPFRSYTTTVPFDLRTGFIERAQRCKGADAPALAEISASGVYRLAATVIVALERAGPELERRRHRTGEGTATNTHIDGDWI
jgi:hypothetical protein